jgi:hypothetical protein
VAPFATLEITVTVDPQGNVVERSIVDVSGLMAQTDTFIPLVPSSQPGMGADTIWAPPAVGSLTFRARAEGSGRHGTSAPVTVTVSDSEPPTVDGVQLEPADGVEPGDVVHLSIEASDNAVVMDLIVRKSGALTGSDTVPVQSPAPSQTLDYLVPSTTPYGTPLSFEVVAVDAAGSESDAVASDVLTIADFTDPQSGGYVYTGIQAPMVPGDTLRGTIEAGDNHRLAWVGYRVGDPAVAQDSFAVTEASVSYDFEAIAQSSWIGTPNVSLFARDSTGNVASQDYPLTITVLDAVRRPYRNASLPASVTDMVFNVKRDRLYLLHSFEISVLPLETFSHEPAILLPNGTWIAGGLETSPDEDELVLLVGFFPDTMTLGRVDLTQAQPAVDTFHLSYDKSLGIIHDLGVASNGKALASLWNGTGGGGLLEYDLLTGAQSLRADAGSAGVVPTPANLVSSGDRGSIFLRWAPVPCCPNDEGQVYASGTGAFGASRSLPFSNSRDGPASSDFGGDRFLVGGHLLDGALGSLGFFDYPTSEGGELIVSAISPDGEIGYFAQRMGTSTGTYLKVRLADDVVLERVLVPETARGLLVLPGGETLIILGATNNLYAIDLR